MTYAMYSTFRLLIKKYKEKCMFATHFFVKQHARDSKCVRTRRPTTRGSKKTGTREGEIVGSSTEVSLFC